MELLFAALVAVLLVVLVIRLTSVDPTVVFIVGVFVFGVWFVYFRGH